MKTFRVALGLVVTLAALSLPADADANCRVASGRLTEYAIDPSVSPNDPFGRLVTSATGSLNSIGTAILTGVEPGPMPDTLAVTTRHLFLAGEGDQLIATGAAVWTAIPNNTTDVNVVLTLTVTGGTGRFANATGTIVATGIGFNVFSPAFNGTVFVYKLAGEFCAG